MENLYDNILSMKKIKLEPEQVLIESNISLGINEEVLKILSVNSCVDLDCPMDALSSECVVSGKVIINVVYEIVGGGINNQSYVSPFSYKLSCEEICNGARLNVTANVVSTIMDKIIGNNLKIITTINLLPVVIKNMEIKYLKDVENKTFTKQDEHEVEEFTGGYCDRFDEGIETSVKNGVKKVLMTNVECLLKDWHAGLNFITVECELYAKVLYADNQEASELQTVVITKEVKQEIEANGVGKDSDLDVYLSLLNEKITTEIVENGEETKISINVPVVVCFNVYACKKVLTISDMYSTQELIAVQNDEVQSYKVLPPEYIDGKIEGGVVLTESQRRIDKYLGVANVCTNISNSYVKMGAVFIEGIVSANVIYINDEVEDLQSVEMEVPFVLSKKVDVGENVILEPYVSIVDVDVMIKRGREIYFDAKGKAFINLTQNYNFKMITKAESIGKIPEKDGAIEIYFGKEGESLWNIAKCLKIPIDIIRGQNPDLSDPLDKDQNIALYYQKSEK